MEALLDELRERVQTLSARSAEAAARSALVVDASRYVRLREALIPRCAWCGRIGLGGRWVAAEAVPSFLVPELERRTTHGICPDCFPTCRPAVASERLAVHAGGWQAAEVLARALERYSVRRRPDYVLEADVPDGDPSGLLSRIADCLTSYRLEPVQVRLGSRTYTLTGR